MVGSNQVSNVASSVVTPVALSGFKTPLLNEFEGASAAYSLRRLKSWEDGSKVVRVRRATDNEEKDFSSVDVANGTMENWVNAYTDLPLDVDSGAAAAYSLRSLGSNQWTYGGDTLEYESDFSAGVDGFGSSLGTRTGNIDGIGNEDDNLRFTVDTSNGQHGVNRGTINQGSTYTISFDIYMPSSNIDIDGFYISARNSSSAITTPTPDTWVSASYTSQVPLSTGNWYVYAAQGGNLLFTGNGTDVFYIRNVKVYKTTGDTEYLPSGKYVVQVRRSSDDATQSFTAAEVADGTLESWVGAGNDGHVKTWYDQSGNANHATQTDTASQPKIVDAGTLKDHLDFDGDVFMDIGEFLMDGTDASTVMVMSNVDTDVETFYLSNRSGSGGFNFKNDTSNKGKLQYSFIGSGSSTTSNVFVDDNTDAKFITTITKDSDDREFFGNGSQLADDGASNTYTQATGTPNTSIGKQGNSSVSAANKKLRVYEIISYDLELGDNRTAIEANIGDYYSIDLPAGVDSGNNEVDGFVTKWYDQSGNGNDAVQATAANQPKIVENGVLVTRNGDAAIKSTSDNLMTLTLGSLSADGQQSVFGVLENDITSQDGYGAAFLVLSTSTSTGGVNRRPYWFTSPTGDLAFSVDSLSGYSNTSRDRHLYSHVMNDAAGGTSTVHQNGTQVDTRSITLDANATFSEGKVLGVTTNATGALYMSEVIYYPSDQSANRTAIETNIADEYGITLS